MVGLAPGALIGRDDDGAGASARSKKSRAQGRFADDKGNFLGKYFRDMAALEVMKPEQEFDAARELEALEIAIWRAALSHPAAVNYVLSVVETCIENSLSEFRSVRRLAAAAQRAPRKANLAKLDKAVAQLAADLRSLDTDRQNLEVLLGELDRVRRGRPRRIAAGGPALSPSKPQVAAWLGRVARADRQAAVARNAFVLANLRLVVSIARRFNHGRMAAGRPDPGGQHRPDEGGRALRLPARVSLLDLRQLVDPSRHQPRAGRQGPRGAAAGPHDRRLPPAGPGQARASAKLGRNATVEELAEATSITAGKIEKMRTYLVDQSVSLDRPVSDEDGRHFIEFLEDPASADGAPAERMTLEALTEEVRVLLGEELKPIEADILRQRFGLDDDHELTLKEIGAEVQPVARADPTAAGAGPRQDAPGSGPQGACLTAENRGGTLILGGAQRFTYT